MELLRVFIDALGPAARADLAAAGVQEVADQIATLVASARSRWPGVTLDAAVFLEHLAGKIRASDDPLGELREVLASDLYLACACAQGDAAALAHFEAEFSRDVDRALSRNGCSGPAADDARQIIRRKLFVGEPDHAPRIGEYSGRGRLQKWVRAVAAREALKVLRSTAQETPVDDDHMLSLCALGTDPETAYLNKVYREAWSNEIPRILESLTSQERSILRQYYIDGLSIDELARLHHIHRSTAARRVDAALRALISRTRRALARKLKVGPAELDSILRLIKSRLDTIPL